MGRGLQWTTSAQLHASLQFLRLHHGQLERTVPFWQRVYTHRGRRYQRRRIFKRSRLHLRPGDGERSHGGQRTPAVALHVTGKHAFVSRPSAGTSSRPQQLPSAVEFQRVANAHARSCEVPHAATRLTQLFAFQPVGCRRSRVQSRWESEGLGTKPVPRSVLVLRARIRSGIEAVQVRGQSTLRADPPPVADPASASDDDRVHAHRPGADA